MCPHVHTETDTRAKNDADVVIRTSFSLVLQGRIHRCRPGGLTTPFKTITYAGGFAGPGDIVNLRGTGHYNNPAVLSRSCVFDKSWAGTACNVVTVQSYPGETAIFDPGYPEFISNPNTAWVPCTDTGAHPDEYVSVNTYTMVSNDGAFGSFLHANGQAGDRLLTYARLEDLRATNESFVRVPVSDPRAGQPIWGDTGYKWLWTYRGPACGGIRPLTRSTPASRPHTSTSRA